MYFVRVVVLLPRMCCEHGALMYLCMCFYVWGKRVSSQLLCCIYGSIVSGGSEPAVVATCSRCAFPYAGDVTIVQLKHSHICFDQFRVFRRHLWRGTSRRIKTTIAFLGTTGWSWNCGVARGMPGMAA